jgi:hypothetical protein
MHLEQFRGGGIWLQLQSRLGQLAQVDEQGTRDAFMAEEVVPVRRNVDLQLRSLPSSSIDLVRRVFIKLNSEL